MRVFVVGTGRCGTSTFYQACKHITNYTVGHETKKGPSKIGDWEFPDNHIEISSNLTIALPHLIRTYPEAKFVRLKRNKQDCIKSLAECVPESMVMFAKQWWYLYDIDLISLDYLKVASTFYDWCEELYQMVLPIGSLFYDIEKMEQNFAKFCLTIEATGKLADGTSEFKKKYNSKYFRGVNNFEP